MCGGAMHVVGNWGFGRKYVRMRGRGRRGELQLTEVWLQKSPNCIMSALLRRHTAVWFLFSLSFWEILRLFLDWRWRSTHSGLLMRKAPRTQKIQQTLLPDLCEVLPGMPRHDVHAAASSYACQAARGSARGRGLTLGSLVMCATSKRIRLRPPPLISGPHCGLQGECVEVMRPWCSSAPTATSTARH